MKQQKLFCIITYGNNILCDLYLLNLYIDKLGNSKSYVSEYRLKGDKKNTKVETQS